MDGNVNTNSFSEEFIKICKKGNGELTAGTNSGEVGIYQEGYENKLKKKKKWEEHEINFIIIITYMTTPYSNVVRIIYHFSPEIVHVAFIRYCLSKIRTSNYTLPKRK